MCWKKMPSWLRGGLILGIILGLFEFIISLILFLNLNIPFLTIPIYFVFLISLTPLFLLYSLSRMWDLVKINGGIFFIGKEIAAIPTLSGIILVTITWIIIGFIIGLIINLIINKFKSSKNN